MKTALAEREMEKEKKKKMKKQELQKTKKKSGETKAEKEEKKKVAAEKKSAKMKLAAEKLKQSEKSDHLLCNYCSTVHVGMRNLKIHLQVCCARKNVYDNGDRSAVRCRPNINV